jgi:Na+-transporting NADH:ubiquinone oxidoreductase subunit NqrA
VNFLLITKERYGLLDIKKSGFFKSSYTNFNSISSGDSYAMVAAGWWLGP